MTQFQPGDRLITATNRRGVVVEVDAQLFPLHTLVQFDNADQPLLILTRCLNSETGVNSMTSMTVIGIDPGKSGAIAIRRNNHVTVHPMPLAGKELDLPAIAEIISKAKPDVVVIEKVHSMPGQGVSSVFTFGCSYGAIQGICSALKLRVELVAPQTWKSSVLKGTKKDKDAAIAYCRRAFPDVPLVLPRCRKPHDGIADALCLSEYGVRVYKPTS